MGPIGLAQVGSDLRSDPHVPSSTADDDGSAQPDAAASIEATANATQPSHRPEWRVAQRVALTVVVVGLLSLGVGLAVKGSGTSPRVVGTPSFSPPPPFGSPTPSPTPPAPAPPFAFRLHTMRFSTLARKGGERQARAAATRVRTALNAFYGAAFLDAASWDGHPSPQVWGAFGSGAVTRAHRDASSLLPARRGTNVATVKLVRSTLDLRILLDASLRPVGADAIVSLRADGVSNDGTGTLHASTFARLLLRPAGNRWVIVGYPTARTTVSSS